MDIATEAKFGITDTDDLRVIRLETKKPVGRIVDVGDNFVFKTDSLNSLTLSDDDLKEIQGYITMLNDRTNDFWQEREAAIANSLPDVDEQTKNAQAELKTMFGDTYLTEEEVRWSASMCPSEFVEAFVELWKEGRIVPKGRNAYGEILWRSAETTHHCV